jgi:prolyl oligopeptidase
VEVTEEYRWLEDGSSEATVAWTAAQQHLTAACFGALPWHGTLRGRVERLLRAERRAYRSLTSGGSLYFAMKEQTPLQQPLLVALTSLDALRTERVVVDPNALEASGETAIDWFVPSPDGERVAVSLSEHGTR